MSRLPSWSVVRLRLFAAATIASAAVISFDSIRHLAESAGFGPLSWLFPLTLDAVAAYGMDLWVRRSAAMRSARWLALAAIFGSLVANVVDHYMVQRSILGAVLGAVPPAALAALLAVAHRHGAGRRTTDHADHSIRDAVWSAMAQAPARSIRGPQLYVIPDRILNLDHAGAVHGPPVGPMLAGPRVEYREVHAPVQIDGPKLEVVQPTPRKRTASTSRTRVAGPSRRTSASLPDDAAVRAWIADQRTTGGVTKATVMDHFGIGSGKALRLMGEV